MKDQAIPIGTIYHVLYLVEQKDRVIVFLSLVKMPAVMGVSNPAHRITHLTHLFFFSVFVSMPEL